MADRSLTIIGYDISNSILPDNEKEVYHLIQSCQKFTILDGILYHNIIEGDKILRVVVYESDRECLFSEAHAGIFGEHLKEAKIYSQLSRHYWWPKVRADIACATRHVGQKVIPPLIPIPVGRPYDRI